MNSNHSKLDVIWTLDEIGGDMHLMGIYDIWPYWVDHQEPINILMWISPAIFFTHIYLQNFCRYALTTTHNDMGLLQNSMPHSIQGLIIILPVNMPVSGHVPFSETPNVHFKKKQITSFFHDQITILVRQTPWYPTFKFPILTQNNQKLATHQTVSPGCQRKLWWLRASDCKTGRRKLRSLRFFSWSLGDKFSSY